MAVTLLFLVYFYPLQFHYHVAKGYARLGYDSAQHQVGLKHFHGHGVEKNKQEAMKWFKLAADQVFRILRLRYVTQILKGHADAALHRGIGNIEGYTHPDDIEPGETEKYLKHASANGHHQERIRE